MTIRPIETRYAGVKYRSRAEARWAVFFAVAGIRVQYEPEGYALPSGAYLPDFLLTDQDVFFEVKGQRPTPTESGKCLELCAATERRVILAIGAPEECFNLLLFDHDGLREDSYILAADRRPDLGLWLVASLEEGVWLGPDNAKGRLKPLGPLFTPLLTAFDAARACRFDRGDARHRPMSRTTNDLMEASA
jgi:hypothetical protein